VQYNKRTNFYFFLVSIAYFAMALFISISIKNYFLGNETKKVERVVLNKIALVRSNFEASIFMDTFLADSLSTLVTIDPDLAFKNWEKIAGQLISKSQHVRNVAASPNNIIRYVYPLKGNESALGVDLSLIPDQNKAIQLARQYQHVYLDGPVKLIQGGNGLIARYPIFSDFPQNKEYWGTVSVVIDYDQLLQSSGIYDIQGADVAIKNITDTPKLIYGNVDIFNRPDTQQIINLPYGKWQLAAKYRFDVSDHLLFIKRTAITIEVLAIFLIYALLLLLYKNYKNIHKAAMHDELTHLPNRRYINNLLKKLTEGKDKGTQFTLLSIDVNDFKDVNDNYGHDVGDRFLKFIATKLKENIRHTDTVARIGGDEFLVILRNVYQTDLVNKIISSLSKEVEGSSFYHKNTEIKPSLSIGFAICTEKNADLDSLMTQADHSMYKDKSNKSSSKKSFTE